MGAPAGAQAGGCPLLVPPEDRGGREEKADVLSVLPVQHDGCPEHMLGVCLGGTCMPLGICAPETPMGTASRSLSTL